MGTKTIERIRGWELASTMKFVLMMIAHHHNDDTRVCFPSVNSLASSTGLDRTTVMRSVKALRKAGALSVVKGARRSNSYIIPETWTGSAAPPVAHCDLSQTATQQVAQRHPDRWHSATLKEGEQEVDGKVPSALPDGGDDQTETDSEKSTSAESAPTTTGGNVWPQAEPATVTASNIGASRGPEQQDARIVHDLTLVGAQYVRADLSLWRSFLEGQVPGPNPLANLAGVVRKAISTNPEAKRGFQSLLPRIEAILRARMAQKQVQPSAQPARKRTKEECDAAAALFAAKMKTARDILRS